LHCHRCSSWGHRHADCPMSEAAARARTPQVLGKEPWECQTCNTANADHFRWWCPQNTRNTQSVPGSAQQHAPAGGAAGRGAAGRGAAGGAAGGATPLADRGRGRGRGGLSRGGFATPPPGGYTPAVSGMSAPLTATPLADQLLGKLSEAVISISTAAQQLTAAATAQASAAKQPAPKKVLQITAAPSPRGAPSAAPGTPAVDEE
jgi:hypothetical protein